jgi:hypothetical protein
MQLIQRNDSRNQENVAVTDNAVTALGRICLYFIFNQQAINEYESTQIVNASSSSSSGTAAMGQPKYPDSSILELVKFWLESLPIREDKQESAVNMSLILQVLQSRQELNLSRYITGGPNLSYLPILISLFMNFLQDSEIEDNEFNNTTRDNVLKMLIQFSKLPTQIFHAIVVTLPKTTQKQYAHLLNASADADADAGSSSSSSTSFSR